MSASGAPAPRQVTVSSPQVAENGSKHAAVYSGTNSAPNCTSGGAQRREGCWHESVHISGKTTPDTRMSAAVIALVIIAALVGVIVVFSSAIIWFVTERRKLKAAQREFSAKTRAAALPVTRSDAGVQCDRLEVCVRAHRWHHLSSSTDSVSVRLHKYSRWRMRALHSTCLLAPIHYRMLGLLTFRQPVRAARSQRHERQVCLSPQDGSSWWLLVSAAVRTRLKCTETCECRPLRGSNTGVGGLSG
jgi:hypothetical protein